MSLITDELVWAVRTAVPCCRKASARRAENVLSLYRFCLMAVRAVLRAFVCVTRPGRSGRPVCIPGIVTAAVRATLRVFDCIGRSGQLARLAHVPGTVTLCIWFPSCPLAQMVEGGDVRIQIFPFHLDVD
jgi:hypothetical protein